MASIFELAVQEANRMAAAGASASAINAYLASQGYGPGQAAETGGGFPSLEVGAGVPGIVPPLQVQAGPVAGLAVTAAMGLVAVIRWLLANWSLRNVLAAILGAVGVGAMREALPELAEGVATVVPGLQPYLGEYPAGLGQIEGRLVNRWTAGGERVYFACFEQPTRQGSHLQYYVWSSKRQAWLPYSYRRNIVFGAKELEIAAALGGRKRIGKKKALRALAGRYGGTRSKKE